MAKHSRKTSWQTIEVERATDFGVAGIGASDLAKDVLTADTADDNFIATSIELAYSMDIEQAAEPNNVGPIHIGLAKSDYSDAEIEAWVENASGFTRANLIQQEISKRHIKHVATFTLPQLAAAEQVSVEVNDGKPIKTRLNWRILEGTTISVWIYNAGTSAIPASSGQVLTSVGQINGFWED